MDNNKISIGLAEDQHLFRKGMASMLSVHKDFEVTCEAGDGIELLSLLRKGPVPDVLLLDLRMPEMSGMDVVKILKEEFPALLILVLSAHNDDRYISHMIELGVNGYLDKNSDPEEVVRAILTIVKTGFYFNQATIHAMRSGLTGGKKRSGNDNPAGLTAREKEILLLICREFTAPEIAEELNLSVRTIEGHRNNLLVKTGARNIAGLVMFAVRNRMLDSDNDLSM